MRPTRPPQCYPASIWQARVLRLCSFYARDQGEPCTLGCGGHLLGLLQLGQECIAAGRKPGGGGRECASGLRRVVCGRLWRRLGQHQWRALLACGRRRVRRSCARPASWLGKACIPRDSHGLGVVDRTVGLACACRGRATHITRAPLREGELVYEERTEWARVCAHDGGGASPSVHLSEGVPACVRMICPSRALNFAPSPTGLPLWK